MHIENLKIRADILQKIRHFFADRNVLEVETPVMGLATVTDPHLHSISVNYQAHPNSQTEPRYLQTSPEYSMKRLLAEGSGCIYQICKAFRNGEVGKQHNPEFSMLEWYRVGFNHHQLMAEVADLLKTILPISKIEKLSYADVFKKYYDINPHTINVETLKEICDREAINLPEGINNPTHDDLLQWLLSERIEPQFDPNAITIIYDYPVSQALLSRIRHDNPPVAERFEVYVGGMELANGFHELTDAKEQLQRFENDLKLREQLGLPNVDYDRDFIAALESGLPDCAGVALGLDRLIMLAAGTDDIADVVMKSSYQPLAQ